MCGLVGIAGEVTAKEERMFADMLVLDTIRGKDSTGVAAISTLANAYTLNVVKAAKSGPEFINEPGFKGINARINRILLGHNRLATRGVINDDNAHPFEFEHIVGAHNGSLLSYSKMFEHEKYSVDSQALYSNMNQNGVADTWSKVDGAAALTWINKDELTVNFLRNKERPLFYCYGNKGRTLMWASEPWMIMVAAMRQGVDCDDKCHEVSVNSHYKFSVPLTADKKIKVTLERTEVKPYERPTYYSGGYQSWEREYETGSSYKGKGAHYLADEGVTYGDTVFFMVDKIRDAKDINGRPIATVIGKSLINTPVRILNLDANSNDELLLAMWDNADGIFAGRVSYADEIGIVLSSYGLRDCGYGLSDLQDADEEDEKLSADSLGEGNHSKKDAAAETKETKSLSDDKKVVELTAAKKSEVKPSLKVIPYKIACSYCRLLVNAYMVDKEAGVTVCCEDCWDNHFAALSTEQRSAVKIGAFSNKAARH